ncbi:hypothetical protein [Burkholderia sp. Bp8998]|uniref:hypothetical protein n=1 Tax=Burkholderia sp. Bp8998 TaxID=2184557 RepID=UPI000F5B847F|nr:hypothetical protein [Burkholderia sp. Bp8998]
MRVRKADAEEVWCERDTDTSEPTPSDKPRQLRGQHKCFHIGSAWTRAVSEAATSSKIGFLTMDSILIWEYFTDAEEANFHSVIAIIIVFFHADRVI